MADYKQLASQEYDSGYNQKVQALKNQLASQLSAYEGQKTGINQNYDTQVNNQNLNTVKSKNNFSNQVLGRGMARSTVATTGLGEMDMINNRVVNQINTQRTGALSGIDAQKTLAQTNMDSTLGTMAGDRENAITTLARQLEDRDYQKTLQEREMKLKEDELAWQKEYQKQQLALSKSKVSSSGGSSSKPKAQVNPYDAMGKELEAIVGSNMSNREKINRLNAGIAELSKYGDSQAIALREKANRYRVMFVDASRYER